MSISKLSNSAATKDKSNLNRELIFKTLHSEMICPFKAFLEAQAKAKPEEAAISPFAGGK